jgi:hypothetical protein
LSADKLDAVLRDSGLLHKTHRSLRDSVEVENVLASYPGVLELAVIGVPHNSCERNIRGDRPRNHRDGEVRLGRKARSIGHMGASHPSRIVRPCLRQIERPVDAIDNLSCRNV